MPLWTLTNSNKTKTKLSPSMEFNHYSLPSESTDRKLRRLRWNTDREPRSATATDSTTTRKWGLLVKNEPEHRFQQPQNPQEDQDEEELSEIHPEILKIQPQQKAPSVSQVNLNRNTAASQKHPKILHQRKEADEEAEDDPAEIRWEFPNEYEGLDQETQRKLQNWSGEVQQKKVTPVIYFAWSMRERPSSIRSCFPYVFSSKYLLGIFCKVEAERFK